MRGAREENRGEGGGDNNLELNPEILERALEESGALEEIAVSEDYLSGSGGRT